MSVKICKAFHFAARLIILILPLLLKVDTEFEFFKNPQKGCEILGFPSAKLNKCGYCVGGETGLSEDYGKDCLGQCDGGAQFDCTGVCDGDAFRDECDGSCIANVFEGNFSSNRDCRGDCTRAELTPEQYAYRLDECGVCRLQSEQPSPFIDCTGKCRPPGYSTAKVVCGQCISPLLNNTHLELFDECGNCKNEEIHCSCDKNPIACGCSDVNRCYKVKRSTPVAFPLRIESSILLTGYFYPVIDALYCVFQHKHSAAIYTSPAFFINRTAIECRSKLPHEGAYAISLKLGFNGEQIIETNPPLIFAYDRNKARYTTMTPSQILTSDLKSDVILNFNGPSLASIPEVPLKCKIASSAEEEKEKEEYEEGEESSEGQQYFLVDGKTPNSCTLEPSRINHKSQTLFITPTFDGLNALSHQFTLTVIASYPTISHQTCFISSDGLAVIIMFQKPVDVSYTLMMMMKEHQQSLCFSLLTEETINRLNQYQVKNCVWTSKVQLVIYLSKPIGENTLEIALRANTIREDSQMIASLNEIDLRVVVRKLTTEWWSYTPKLIITGPSEIPRCGVFALSAHFSSPSGTSGVRFRWSVRKDGDGLISDHLSRIVQNANTQNLVLDSDYFDIGNSYQFTLQASTDDSDANALEATHRVVRFDYDAPIVSLYSTIMLPFTPFTVNQMAILWAETYVPRCVFPFQRVGHSWKVFDPKVRFNFSLARSPIYVLSPFSLPVDQPVTFILSAFLGFRTNETSGAAISILTQQAPLKAIISDGSPMIAIGSESGPFRLSADGSGSGRKEKLIYHWSCVDGDTHQPCYNNFAAADADLINIASDSYLIFDRSTQRQKELNFNSRVFEANRELIIGLQVYDINNTSRASETEFCLLKVVPREAPQIFMGSIYMRGKHKATIRSPHNLAIIVSAHTSLIIKARVIASTEIASIKWESPNFIHALYSSNTKINSNETISELHLHEDYIFPYAFHVIKLRACTVDDHCSEASTQFTVSQWVTQCELQIADSYVEYEMIHASVERCNIPPGYAPLVYQLYAQSSNDKSAFPVTVPQYSSVFILKGIPAANSERKLAFSARICDAFHYCEMTSVRLVHIESNRNNTSKDLLLNEAQRYNLADDPFRALSVLATLMRGSINDKLENKAIEATIDYMVKMLQRPSQLVSKGQISLAFYVLSNYIKYTNSDLLKKQALDAIHKLSEKSIALQTLPDLMSIEQTLDNLVHLAESSDVEINSTVLIHARRTFRTLLRLTAMQIPLGKKVQFGESDAENSDGQQQQQEAVTVIVHSTNIDDLNLSLKLKNGKSISASIEVSKDLKRAFSPWWRCGKNTFCNSVVYSLTLFPNSTLFPRHRDAFRLTPIADFTIYAPNTGIEQNVRGFLKTVVVSLTVTGNQTAGGQKFSTKCHYWNENDQVWHTGDVHLVRIAGGEASCWAGHLTAFAVFRVDQSLKIGMIIGTVVAVLVTMLILAVLTVVIVQKRQDAAAAARISSQHLVCSLRDAEKSS